MSYDILIPLAVFVPGMIFINYFANFPEYNYVHPMLISFLALCVIYAYLFLKKIDAKKDFHKKNIWTILTITIGSGVVLGLVNEWSDKLCELFAGYYGLSLFIAILGGGAFFALLINKSQELLDIFDPVEGKKTDSQKKLLIFKFLTFAFSLSFWFVLLTSYYDAPWYVHVILLLVSISLSFSLEYVKHRYSSEESKCLSSEESKGLSLFYKALDSIILFNIMPAHFAAEGSIAGAMVNGAVKVPVVLASIFQESVLDLPSLINPEHCHDDDPKDNDSEEKQSILINPEHCHDDDPKDNDSEEKQSILSLIAKSFLSISYVVCLVILGYTEIPDALKVIGINSEQITFKVLTVSILILGGISSALVVFNNLYSPEKHQHGELKFFGLLNNKQHNDDHHKENLLSKCSRYFFAFFGAILTSTVGVVIASELFSIPIWLSVVMTLFAFVVEFKFHETNLKMTESVFIGIKSSFSDSDCNSALIIK